MSNSWKSTHYQDQHGCFHVSMPPCLLISTSAFPSSLLPISYFSNKLPLLLLSFGHWRSFTHCLQSHFFNPETIPYWACLFCLMKIQIKSKFLKVTLKQKRLLLNQLLMSKSNSKTLFLFYFYFFIFLKPALSLITSDFFTAFFKRKMVPPNGRFSNGKHYQTAHQPLVSQLYIQVTLYNLLL